MKKFAIIVSIRLKPGREAKLSVAHAGHRRRAARLDIRRQFPASGPRQPDPLHGLRELGGSGRVLRRPVQAGLQEAFQITTSGASCRTSADRNVAAFAGGFRGSRGSTSQLHDAVRLQSEQSGRRSGASGTTSGVGRGPGVIEGAGPDNEVGSVRAFTYYEISSPQRLTAHSDAKLTYSWESCKPYESIDHYELTLKVEPVGARASKVTWTARYEAPEAEAPKWDAFFAEESQEIAHKAPEPAGRAGLREGASAQHRRDASGRRRGVHQSDLSPCRPTRAA